MKIPLHMENVAGQTGSEQLKSLARDILAAKGGDWTAKNNLVRTFSPLITSLAEKRTDDVATINKYIEAGKQGLSKATKKFKPAQGADKFQLFALDFIEASMDRAARGSSGDGPGFFARLFGRS